MRVPPCGGAATAGEGEEKEKGKRENYRLAAGRLDLLETRTREEITGVTGSCFLALAQFLLNKILSFGRGSLPGYTLDVACSRRKSQNHGKRVDFGQSEGEIRNQHRRITPLQGA